MEGIPVVAAESAALVNLDKGERDKLSLLSLLPTEVMGRESEEDDFGTSVTIAFFSGDEYDGAKGIARLFLPKEEPFVWLSLVEACLELDLAVVFGGLVA